MKRFLNNKLDQIGAKKITFLAPLISFLSDLILIWYINNHLLNQYLNHQMIRSYSYLFGVKKLDYQTANFILDATVSSLSLVFWFILLYNVIIYLLTFTKLKWPITYMKGYTFSAVLLSILEMITTLIKFLDINLITFITTITYFMAFLGFRYLQGKKE